MDQQEVEVLPFLRNRSFGHARGGNIRPQDDPLKVLGFDRLEGHSDPPRVRSYTSKYQAFEFRDSGGVKQNRPAYPDPLIVE